MLLKNSLDKCEELSVLIKRVRDNEGRLQEFYCAPTMPLETIADILCQAFEIFHAALTVSPEIRWSLHFIDFHIQKLLSPAANVIVCWRLLLITWELICSLSSPKKNKIEDMAK